MYCNGVQQYGAHVHIAAVQSFPSLPAAADSAFSIVGELPVLPVLPVFDRPIQMLDDVICIEALSDATSIVSDITAVIYCIYLIYH
jgi:hypothetical protein